MHDLVVTGGRVVDPAQGIDAVVDLGITAGRVSGLGPGLEGRARLDASGCVVSPGFVDLHSHAQTLAGHRLQAHDGVTTALDLESGVAPVATAYRLAAEEGRPLHYGYSAAWASARMEVLGGWAPDGTIASMLSHIGAPAWQGEASPGQTAQILSLLEAQLADGALGIGVLVGYAQRSDPREYLAVCALAARTGVPTFTHARDLVETSPTVAVDGAAEIVRAAAETGAHMHYCHVNSTSLRHVDRVLGLVDRVRSEGATVSTEAYPYGAGMTGIGAEFLAPERLAARGMTPSSLTYAPTGERVADAARLRHLRDTDPGGLAIVRFLDEDSPDDAAVLARSLSFADTCYASDAMPLTWQGVEEPGAWPLPFGAFTHPRSAGTFARAYQVGGRDVVELVRRASVLPAAVLAAATGGTVRKGTLAVGSDADVTVFDPAAFRDQATYEEPTRTSTGVRHLLVDGVAVIRDGALVLDARPGRAVRRA